VNFFERRISTILLQVALPEQSSEAIVSPRSEERLPSVARPFRFTTLTLKLQFSCAS
jgi:hypothetical protein